MRNSIEINGLRFAYEKGKPVLNDVRLYVEEGAVLAVLGKNGCGKSTLLDCIIGCNDVKDGCIKVNGQDIKAVSDKEMSQNVAYMSQRTDINMDFSVLEFILFGRTCRLRFGASPAKADYDIAKTNAEKCGITHLLSKSVNKLSGGERQLAFIARVLTQESPIIIMDEPTAALDFGNQLKICKMIGELQSQGRTVVFTTHNPMHVLYMNCHVAVMQAGKVTRRGNARDAITKAALKEMYGDIVYDYVEQFPAFLGIGKML